MSDITYNSENYVCFSIENESNETDEFVLLENL